VAEIALEAAPILAGPDHVIGENRITQRSDLGLVSVAIPQEGKERLAGALKHSWSLSIPLPTACSSVGDFLAVPTAPDQFLLIFPHDGPDAEALVRHKLDGAGYTTDQTDVWVVLEVAGPDTHAALERLCPIDLSLQVFPKNAAARTVMEHMGAMVIRISENSFLLLSASSSAGSFLHAVETSYRNALA